MRAIAAEGSVGGITHWPSVTKSRRKVIIWMVRVDVGCPSRAGNVHNHRRLDRDGVSGQRCSGVTAQRDVSNKVQLTVAARRIKLQHRIGVDCTAAYIKSAVVAESADFNHVGTNVCVVDVNRSALAIVFDVHGSTSSVGGY